MQQMKRRDTIKSIALCASLALAPGLARAETLVRMESVPATSANGQVGVAIAQLAKKYAGVTMQVSVGKATTKGMIAVAMKQSDFVPLPPIIVHYMQTQTAMYKDLDQAPELVKELRSIFNFPLGVWNFVVYADSGIESLDDFKGRRVFIGPPGGAATDIAADLIEISTGLKTNEDYEAVPFDWDSAITAFLDRQIDSYTGPTTVPSAMIEQFALASKVRFLGVPDQYWETDEMKALLSQPGITEDVVPPGAYKNQVNDTPVRTVGTWSGYGTRVGMDEEVVYQITKAFWDHLDEVHETAPWMSIITPEIAFSEMILPLHVGAYRYYKEAGFNIPAELVPPEAK